jgi:hypothetical protein
MCARWEVEAVSVMAKSVSAIKLGRRRGGAAMRSEIKQNKWRDESCAVEPMS